MYAIAATLSVSLCCCVFRRFPSVGPPSGGVCRSRLTIRPGPLRIRPQVEAAALKAVMEVSADPLEGVDEMVAEALSRPDTLPPRAVAAAATSRLSLKSRGSISPRRADCTSGRCHTTSASGHLAWSPEAVMPASPRMNSLMSRPQSRYSEQRCIPPTSQPARIRTLRASLVPCSALYERGETAEAERLLDESYELGSEGGAVDFMIARYVRGARVKAVQGGSDRFFAVCKPSLRRLAAASKSPTHCSNHERADQIKHRHRIGSLEVVHHVHVGVTRAAPPILTRTWPGPGVGFGISTSSGSVF